MNLAHLAFLTAVELAHLAHGATGTQRERADARRKALRAIDVAMKLQDVPDSSDPEAWDAWQERVTGEARTRGEVPREELQRELSELRAELARRDAEAHAAWTGTED